MTRRDAHLSLLLILTLAACGPGGDATDGDAGAGAARPAPPVRATVTAHDQGGGRLLLTWRFDLADGWHLYWPGVNDSGFPPQIALEVPDGWTAGPLRFPVPTRHVLPGEILDHVLAGPAVVVRQTVLGPAAATDTLRARVRWLACREACVPGDADLTVVLPRDLAPAAAAPAAGAYPAPLPPDAYRAEREGDVLVIAAPGAAALRFFPDEGSGPWADLLHEGEAAGELLRLRLEPRDGAPATVRGLLQIERPDGTLLTGPLAL